MAEYVKAGTDANQSDAVVVPEGFKLLGDFLDAFERKLPWYIRLQMPLIRWRVRRSLRRVPEPGAGGGKG